LTMLDACLKNLKKPTRGKSVLSTLVIRTVRLELHLEHALNACKPPR
jgi:hypothetical protein